MGGMILVLLAGFSGRFFLKKSQIYTPDGFFAIIIEFYHLSLKEFMGNEKHAARSPTLRVFLSREFI